MNPALILQAVVTYGPTVLPVLHEIAGWVEAKKETVTQEDIAKLIEYGRKDAADYLREAQKTAGAQGPN